MFVALYSTCDAWGIRATANPFTLPAWVFMLGGLFIPRWSRTGAGAGCRSVKSQPLARRGGPGAFVACFPFGSILLATRLGRIGRAAVLRKTSTVIAALIGRAVPGEKVGPPRWG